MSLEVLLRWISAVVLIMAALSATWAAVRWAHPVVRPAFRFAAPVVWISAIYRTYLAAAQTPAGGEFAELIRLGISVQFFLWGVMVLLFAQATREVYRLGLVMVPRQNRRGDRE